LKLSPDTPLRELEWVPRNRVAPLARLGLETLADLIRHYPRRYEDRQKFDRFPDGEMDHAICICGIVAKTATKRFGGWKRMFEAILEDDTGGILSQPVTCRWFNMPYIQKLVLSGQRLVVYGRPKQKGRQVVIDHPEFESIEEDEDEPIHLQRIAPIHPAGDGITPRVLRVLIHRALAETDLVSYPSLLPQDATFPRSLRAIHFPDSYEELEAARAKLVREEFFAVQLLLNARRNEWAELPGFAKKGWGELLNKFLKSLPFSLTASQQEVITQIRGDLAAPHRMNRLLQGDVGSGKTVVALCAMLVAVEAGWQAALMAPTQILAEQHYLNFQRMLEPLGVSVALRTGSRKEDALAFFDNKPPQIVVGTHALLYEKADFEKLGLIVIDEQHKFGVLQRAQLITRGDAPDVLVMTATPIPRTYTQTLYGDLDVSTLREKPAERGKIITAVRESAKLPDVVDFVRKQLDEGRQAYVVYPLVEESDKLAAKSATAEFEKWKPLLAPHTAGLIHGRLAPAEKEAIMARFRSGEIACLIATTVIEVGVDVPNANIMVVENAERFGLAQLHQLRGRIGRGPYKSYCVLLHDPKAPNEAKEKLAVLEKTSDGFEIAEADLRMRGPGDLLGTAQTGLPPLRLGDLFRDADLMMEMRKTAADLFKSDPALDWAEHQHLKAFLAKSHHAMDAAAG